MKTRAELDAALADLESKLEAMIRDYPDSDLMDAFAGEAEAIEEATGPDDREHVNNRIQCMLRDAGLIPGDDEPCDE